MRRFLLFSLLAMFPIAAAAQKPAPDQSKAEQQTKPRPKIGVALEGGGALGLAHIGVLQWFEDHHIPVDYIAGTSMGGLVAGLYATGKSPEELRELVEKQHWDTIIGGRSPYEDLSFRRKEDQRDYPNYLILGLKHGVTVPSGLNPGQKISLLIDHETISYSQLKSFDDLPIPYRCVATDLVSGKETVFSEGDLALAMRSTMSIPGVFTPVRDGEHVYVDGGLVGNLPTDVVRQMGADIVIGVHLEIAPANADQIRSLFDVLGRSIDVVIRENELRGLAAADLVVNVNLKDFNSMDYEKSESIIGKGNAAAAGKEAVLSPFALDAEAWQKYVAERAARQRKPERVVPQAVEVRGVSREAEEPLQKFLRPLIGKPLDTEEIDEILTRLAGVGKFDTAGYRIESRNGQTVLAVVLHEKFYGPPTLQPGFEVDGSESQDVTFTQAARLTFMDVAGYRSEWRTDFLFGDTYGISSELYRPISPTSKWFVAPHGAASLSSFRVYSRSDPVAIYGLDRESIGADFGYGFNRFAEIRVGYSIGRIGARLRLGQPEFLSDSGRVGETHAQFRFDHVDDPIVPGAGFRGEVTFHWYDHYLDVLSPFPAGEAKLGFFQPVTPSGSIFLTASGGTSSGTSRFGFPLYFLGGVTRLSAYGSNELFGNQYYLLSAGYRHRLFSLPPFLGKDIFALGAVETGKMYNFPLPTQTALPIDVEMGVIAETALGPFFIGGSVGDSGHRKWFFQLGRVF